MLNTDDLQLIITSCLILSQKTTIIRRFMNVRDGQGYAVFKGSHVGFYLVYSLFPVLFDFICSDSLTEAHCVPLVQSEGAKVNNSS